MTRRPSSILLAAALWLATGPAMAGEPTALYAQHCASCHGADRLGGMGPALLPENLERLKKTDAVTVIAEGRANTQMPAFGALLDAISVAAMADYVYTPLPELPHWDMAEIAASRTVVTADADLPTAPQYQADPLNLFVVVESGDHHVTILDGDSFEPLTRFQSHFALHGGPKFSPDGRFVYFMSRDGWVTKYDLWGLTTVAEVRAGINSRNIALSDDGAVVAVANYLPNSLVMLDAHDLSPLTVIPTADWQTKKGSRVSAVYQAAPRQSFIVALKDAPELWEVSYAVNPPPNYSGLVHSYEEGMVEAVAGKTGRFPIRRIFLKEPLDDFFIDPSYSLVIGSMRDSGRTVAVQLDVRQEIAELPLPGLPHLASGISWLRQGRRVLATPNLKEAAVSIIDLQDFHLIKRIPTLGPGFFMRSHENSRYAWVDSSFGEKRDTMQVIDKETLEIVAYIQPAPGKTAAHVEFTRDGRYALLSIAEMDGAIVVYDAVTLQEVKRIPMVKPLGKYNVFNKISRSDGTSH